HRPPDRSVESPVERDGLRRLEHEGFSRAMHLRRALRLIGVCSLWALAFLLPLRAEQRDLRLLEAVKRRDDKAFAALRRARVDVNAAQPDGATALAWAIHLGERRMAAALLDAGANANAADEYGETPVTLAAAAGDAALLQRLLAAGGNVGA